MSEMNKDGMLVNLKNLGVDLPTIIVVLAMAFSSYVWLDGKFDNLNENVNHNTVGIAKNVVSPAHAWRRWDMALWCAKAEKRNKDFKCPDPYGQAPARPRDQRKTN